MTLCFNSKVFAGKVTINKQAVSINETIALQGGSSSMKRGGEFVGALNGEPLSKTPQNVPGDLLDFVNCEEIKGSGFFEVIERAACKAVFENKTTGVSAVTEFAKPASRVV